MQVLFSLDCCDREAMQWLATSGGVSGEGGYSHYAIGLIQSATAVRVAGATPRRLNMVSAKKLTAAKMDIFM